MWNKISLRVVLNFENQEFIYLHSQEYNFGAYIQKDKTWNTENMVTDGLNSLARVLGLFSSYLQMQKLIFALRN